MLASTTHADRESRTLLPVAILCRLMQVSKSGYTLSGLVTLAGHRPGPRKTTGSARPRMGRAARLGVTACSWLL